MKLAEAKVCILRVGGTNCDAETRQAFESSGMPAEVLHFNQVAKQHTLLDYDVLVIPGGFSHGDYVRAGAIWAKQLMTRMGKDVVKFVEDERLILGICNGFQVLVEAGLLPQFNGISLYPQAALATNTPSGYRCKWIHLRHENRGSCVSTAKLPAEAVLRIPIAHSEGCFVFPKEQEAELLDRLLDGDQLVFRYCHAGGKPAEGVYPFNPNGSFYDIAGICNPSGKIFGLMPHPERAYFGWQQPDWTRSHAVPAYGDGRLIIESIADYLAKL